MKSIIVLLTISIIFLAAFVMKQKNPEPGGIDASTVNNEKTAETVASDKREIVMAFKEKSAAAAPTYADTETGRNVASKDELRDAVIRKDKEAALAIVSRIMKDKRDRSFVESKDWDYGGHQSSGNSAKSEDDDDED